MAPLVYAGMSLDIMGMLGILDSTIASNPEIPKMVAGLAATDRGMPGGSGRALLISVRVFVRALIWEIVPKTTSGVSAGVLAVMVPVPTEPSPMMATRKLSEVFPIIQMIGELTRVNAVAFRLKLGLALRVCETEIANASFVVNAETVCRIRTSSNSMVIVSAFAHIREMVRVA